MESSIRPWWAAVVVAALMFSGCTINRDIMFKTPTDYEFSAFQDTASKNLILQPNDALQFRLFANDGFKMIDLVSDNSNNANLINRTLFIYYIDAVGEVKLPLLDHVALSGLSIRAAEMKLEEMYARYYQRPYVQVQVVNRRVVVFPGGGGDARVITLENNNTTLLEVLAQAGGVNKRGDARKVKLFRHHPDGTRTVHQFDMSDISGLKDADIVMQGDDVLYVQPNAELAREALSDLQPVITLLTSIVLVIGVVRGFN
ncbi:MAG: polysaccharide biosynthesis/export family protein [Flavobacteriales bacterium]|nr:polysaccharide biosynthesis/export family protein [Flavobacteriales bacterium]